MFNFIRKSRQILVEKIFLWQIKEILSFSLALIPLSGALIYYFYKLNILGIFGIAILTLLAIFLIFKNKKVQIADIDFKKNFIFNKSALFYLLPFLFFSFLSFKELFNASTSQSLISPWQVLGNYFFIFYALSALFLIFLNNQKLLGKFWKLKANIIFYFLSFSICSFVFKIGYGFDPFIHEATMEYIKEHGQILPKNPYYLGQYSLIIFLNKISGLSIDFLNRFLVPTLAALSLPLIFNKFSKSYLKENVSLLPIAILIIGFSPFIMTAPQNLAYLFLILSIFFSLTEKSLLKSSLFALATIAIHPLSGLPALAFIAFSFWQKNKHKWSKKFKNIFLSLIFIFNSLSIPLALFISGEQKIQLKQIIFNLNVFFKNIWKFDLSGQENIFLNFIYLFEKNKLLILIILIICALIYLKRNKINNENFKNLLEISYLNATSLFIAFILSLSLTFKDVISYEQNIYSSRILTIILIIFLPALLVLFSQIIKDVNKHNLFTKISCSLVLSSLLLTGIYFSYPRLDKYHNSRGYSTGEFDLKAVKIIEEGSKNEKYFVLANQQVSAAALKTFGFEKNIKTSTGEIYFYPIPTGGMLYEYYLKMVYDEPSQKNIKEAMDLLNIQTAYLVINRYWHRSAELINQAKIEAENWQEINNEVFIFKY